MPRKTLQQRRKRPTDTDTNVNRVRQIVDGMIGNEDPDDLMVEISRYMPSKYLIM